MSHTQLTSANNFDINRMIFSTPIKMDKPVKHSRINISYRNPNGTVGDLVLSTEKLFSWGVAHNTDQATGEIVRGYKMPLVMWDKNGPSAEEKKWTDTIEDILEKSKDHLVSVKKEIGKFSLEKYHLDKLTPFYWKIDKSTGEIDEKSGPTLYAKLISMYKNGEEKIMSAFYDMDSGDEISPTDLIEKRCFARCAIKVESIFIGGTSIKLQLKLWDAEVSIQSSGMQRLIRPSSTTPLSSNNASATAMSADSNDDNDDDISFEAGSVQDSDEDFAPAPPTPVKQPAPKRRGKVAAK